MKRFPPLNVTALVLVNEGNGKFHWDGRTRTTDHKLLVVTEMESPEEALGVLMAAEIKTNAKLRRYIKTGKGRPVTGRLGRK